MFVHDKTNNKPRPSRQEGGQLPFLEKT